MRNRNWLAVLAAVALAAGCAPRTSDETAAVYTGGDILTLAGEAPAYVEALAVKDGKIVAAGTQAEARKAAGPGARTVDLKGGVLMPGFIDAHSHLLNYADSLVQANLNPPPVGGVSSVADIVGEVKRLKDSLKAAPGVLLVGQGYDQDFLAEMVAMDNPASQDSKANLAHPTSNRMFNDPEASYHIDLIKKQSWMSMIL